MQTLQGFQGDAQKLSQLAKFLSQQGFEGSKLNSWLTTVIPDTTLALMLKHPPCERSHSP